MIKFDFHKELCQIIKIYQLYHEDFDKFHVKSKSNDYFND